MKTQDSTDGASGNDEILALQQAMISSAYLPLLQPAVPAGPNCTTGNCIWYPFGALAVCSRVENLSSVGNSTLLSKLDSTTRERLSQLHDSASTMRNSKSNGTRHANHTRPYRVWPVSIVEMDSPSGAFDSSITNLTLADLLVAYPNDYMNITDLNSNNTSSLTGFQYFELVFHWCVAEFHVKVADGLAKTNLTTTSTTVKTSNSTDQLNKAWSKDFNNCDEPVACNYTVDRGRVVMAPPPGMRTEEESVDYMLDVNSALAVSNFVNYQLGGGILSQEIEEMWGRPVFEQGVLAYPLTVLMGGKPGMALDDQDRAMRTIAGNIATGITNE